MMRDNMFSNQITNNDGPLLIKISTNEHPNLSMFAMDAGTIETKNIHDVFCIIDTADDTVIMTTPITNCTFYTSNQQLPKDILVLPPIHKFYHLAISTIPRLNDLNNIFIPVEVNKLKLFLYVIDQMSEEEIRIVYNKAISGDLNTYYPRRVTTAVPDTSDCTKIFRIKIRRLLDIVDGNILEDIVENYAYGSVDGIYSTIGNRYRIAENYVISSEEVSDPVEIRELFVNGNISGFIFPPTTTLGYVDTLADSLGYIEYYYRDNDHQLIPNTVLSCIDLEPRMTNVVCVTSGGTRYSISNTRYYKKDDFIRALSLIENITYLSQKDSTHDLPTSSHQLDYHLQPDQLYITKTRYSSGNNHYKLMYNNHITLSYFDESVINNIKNKNITNRISIK